MPFSSTAATEMTPIQFAGKKAPASAWLLPVADMTVMLFSRAMSTAAWITDGHGPWPAMGKTMILAGVGLVDAMRVISPPALHVMASAISELYPIPHAPSTLTGWSCASNAMPEKPPESSGSAASRVAVEVPCHDRQLLTGGGSVKSGSMESPSRLEELSLTKS